MNLDTRASCIKSPGERILAIYNGKIRIRSDKVNRRLLDIPRKKCRQAFASDWRAFRHSLAFLCLDPLAFSQYGVFLREAAHFHLLWE